MPGSRVHAHGFRAGRLRPYRRSVLLAAALAAAALAAACGGTTGEAVETQAGPYALTARLDPDPPQQSGGTLRLEVRDAEGASVNDADVSVGYFMPAMGTMAEMRGSLDVESESASVYVATLDFPMTGSWRIDVAVAGEAGRGAATYRLTVGSKGLRLEDSSGQGAATAASPRTLPTVTQQEAATATIRIDAARRQEIGVKTERVARQPLSTQVRAVGRVVYDETLLSDVSLRIGGWIGRLDADEPGQYVGQGETLFTLYSQDLYAAQQEFLTAVASQRAAAATAAPDRADYLVEAARTRLRLWDLSPDQIDQIAATGQPIEYLPILSPASGYVVEKNVVRGAAVRPGERLFRIAGIDRVWVEAEVYESDLPVIAVGQRATVTLPYAPGRTFAGEISFIYPYLEGTTRTARVRVALPNPDMALKPDMYADVTIQRDLGERLTVPEQAVLYAGERSFVFLDLGEGRLRPNEVATGLVTGDRIEILAGLEPGDVIVTSGNFLVAAEARLKLAMEQWR
jgi:Cu(I)/Ag(I) efflux system membrane fusion protein